MKIIEFPLNELSAEERTTLCNNWDRFLTVETILLAGQADPTNRNVRSPIPRAAHDAAQLVLSEVAWKTSLHGDATGATN